LETLIVGGVPPPNVDGRFWSSTTGRLCSIGGPLPSMSGRCWLSAEAL
jgi:hypothetical protein